MEKKTVNKKKSFIITKTVSVIVYVANDGSEFDNENECLNHEKKIKAIEIGQPQFKEIKLDECSLTALVNICFNDCYSKSSIQLIVWKSTQNSQLIKEAADFLKAKSFNHINEFFKTKPKKNYLIASWREFDGIDSEESEGGIIELTKAIGKVNDLKNILEKSSHK